MKRNIHLYGYLAEKYGECHSLYVHSVGEAVRALKANFPDFYDTIREGKYHVLRGESLENCKEMREEEFTLLFMHPEDFHIMPVIEGGKSGWVNIAIGAVLMAAAYFIPGAQVGFVAGMKMFMMGTGMALVAGGAIMLLTPAPSTPNYMDREEPDERASFIFNGPVNRYEQGGAVPLVYGQMMVGSILIAGALDVEQLLTAE